jgi:uncharacterized protein (TIGR02118 family)
VIKVTIMYPNTPGALFDLDYYCNKHIPMVQKRLGELCKHCTVEKGLSGIIPGSLAAYIVISDFLFDSIDSFQSAFSPHGAEIMGDFIHYTNLVPLIQISEVMVG